MAYSVFYFHVEKRTIANYKDYENALKRYMDEVEEYEEYDEVNVRRVDGLPYYFLKPYATIGIEAIVFED